MIDKDFKIDFIKKQISYHPKGSDKMYSVNQLYSYLQDSFDEPDTMDDDIPIKAISRDKYLLVNGWTIDNEGLKHLQDKSLITTDKLKTKVVKRLVWNYYNFFKKPY